MILTHAWLCACFAGFGKVNNIPAQLVYGLNNLSCGSFGC